jgi:hypothetical protein
LHFGYIMNWNGAINDIKLEINECYFNAFVFTNFNVIRIIKVREHNDYNVNEKKTSLKTTLFILVILWVEMSATNDIRIK